MSAARRCRRHMGDRLLGLFGLLAMLLALVALGALLYDVARDGLGRLSWAVHHELSIAPGRAGRHPAGARRAACTSSA